MTTSSSVRLSTSMVLLAFQLSMRPTASFYGTSKLCFRARRCTRGLTTTSLLLQVDKKCNYYLLKSEPSAYSIQDMQKDVEEEWDGVRNFQARNKLRSMKVGDLAYFYHSSCSVPGIVGTVHIVREAEPDLTALDPNHQGYDAKSTPENCRWDAVRVRFETIFQEPVTLKELKTRAQNEEIIGSLSLLRQSRLSVHELTEDQWNAIQALAGSNIETHGNEKETTSEAKDASVPNYFVLKSNPSKLSIHDLHQRRGMEGDWHSTGKNKAEKSVLKSIKGGDLAYFYHSSCATPGIVGTVQIVDEPKQDESNRLTVRIRLDGIFRTTTSLQEIKAAAERVKSIEKMTLTTHSRTSLHELTTEQWEALGELTRRRRLATACEDSL